MPSHLLLRQKAVLKQVGQKRITEKKKQTLRMPSAPREKILTIACRRLKKKGKPSIRPLLAI
jgi:hypothetical protein